jgi:multidrug resistance efflux pump
MNQRTAVIEELHMTPVSPHSSPRRRWLSFVWLLGFASLAVSLGGAGWMMRTNAGPALTAAPGGANTAALHCLGHVDVPDGVSFPYPAAAGRVVEVKVREGQAVKAGDVLYRVDDRVRREDFDRAQNAVATARIGEDRAANAGKKHEQLVAAQEQAVEAARSELDAAQIGLDRKRALYEKNNLVKEDVDAAEKLRDKARAGVKGEEAKLAALKLAANDIAGDAKLAAADVLDKQKVLAKAQLALDECVVKAPADGSVLRLDLRAGDLLPPEPKAPPLIFCPAGPRVVRAEVEQEWAGRVQEGQVASIEDDTANGSGPKWTGRVVRVGDWMAHRRSILPDPSQFHDIRTLECIIELDPGQAPLRIGQRVRVALSNP